MNPLLERRAALLSLLGVAAVPNEALYSAQEQELAAAAAESAADSRPKFFSPAAFADFARLGEILIPSYDGRPGAKEARAADFLDFLLSVSPAPLQQQYRVGLAAFKAQGEKGIGPALAAQNEFGKFLTIAKVAFYRATINSREYSAAMSERSRSAAGLGNFWLPLG